MGCDNWVCYDNNKINIGWDVVECCNFGGNRNWVGIYMIIVVIYLFHNTINILGTNKYKLYIHDTRYATGHMCACMNIIVRPKVTAIYHIIIRNLDVVRY